MQALAQKFRGHDTVPRVLDEVLPDDAERGIERIVLHRGEYRHVL